MAAGDLILLYHILPAMAIPTMGNPYAVLRQMLIRPIIVQRIAAIEYPQTICMLNISFKD